MLVLVLELELGLGLGLDLALDSFPAGNLGGSQEAVNKDFPARLKASARLESSECFDIFDSPPFSASRW